MSGRGRGRVSLVWAWVCTPVQSCWYSRLFSTTFVSAVIWSGEAIFVAVLVAVGLIPLSSVVCL